MLSSPTIANGVVYAGRNTGEVLAWRAGPCGNPICNQIWSGAVGDQIVTSSPTVVNGQLYIGGSFDVVSGVPARNIASWDGNSWHALGAGVSQSVNALAVAPSRELFAVGAFTKAGDLPVHYVARWDGQTWHAMRP